MPLALFINISSMSTFIVYQSITEIIFNWAENIPDLILCNTISMYFYSNFIFIFLAQSSRQFDIDKLNIMIIHGSNRYILYTSLYTNLLVII